jgi:hypothetical protein
VKFWDASAIVPLCLEEPSTPTLSVMTNEDSSLVVWWATRSECVGAFVRRLRGGTLDAAGESRARSFLARAASSWLEVEPSEDLRSSAERVLAVHPLRTADAFQLAAALHWCQGRPANQGFVSLDNRLRRAANAEGFAVLPTRAVG